jgi:tetratricopeptide (TPR) repeat protein
VSAFSAFRKAQQFARDADAKREAEASLLALHPSLIQESQQSLAEGAIEAAWQSYDAAVAIRPDDAEELRRTLLRVTREKVRELWNGKSASVVPLCHRYLAEAPSDAYVLTVLGRTLMGSHAYSEALPIWERLCARDLSDGHYRLQVARCCRALNLVEKGILSAEEALRLDPGLREASEVAEFLKIAQRRESRSASAERQ